MARRINGILVSYDYEELLAELLSDIEEFDLEYVWITRGEEQYGYEPIIDYYYPEDLECATEDKVQAVSVEEVVAEMKELITIL